MRAICVFCASSPGVRPAYLAAAREVGTTLAARGITVVYGGGKVGLMGAVADAALAAGGRVIGVIPSPMVDKEIAHRGVTELRVVPSMHARKQLMHELSDGFLTLPGGFGTFEELFETLTWAQLGMHRKPCGLLNVAGYYDPLLTMIEHAVREGLLRAEHHAALVVAANVDEILTKLDTYVPPDVPKWIAPSQT